MHDAKGSDLQKIFVKYSADKDQVGGEKTFSLRPRSSVLFYLVKKVGGDLRVQFRTTARNPRFRVTLIHEVHGRGRDIASTFVTKASFATSSSSSFSLSADVSEEYSMGSTSPLVVGYAKSQQEFSFLEDLFSSYIEADEEYYIRVENMGSEAAENELILDFEEAVPEDSPCTSPELGQEGRTYEAQWVSQTQGTDPGLGNPIVMQSGETRTISVRFRNTGTATWYSLGEERVAFYVYRDVRYSTPTKYNVQGSAFFGQSLFQNSAWGPSADGTNPHARSAVLDQCSVAPGEEGTFYVTLYVPSDTTCNADGDLPDTVYNDYYYRDDYSLAYGPNWMKNPTNGDPMGVAHVWVPVRVPCEDNVPQGLGGERS